MLFNIIVSLLVAKLLFMISIVLVYNQKRKPSPTHMFLRPEAHPGLGDDVIPSKGWKKNARCHA